jgi:hypothetical protein
MIFFAYLLLALGVMIACSNAWLMIRYWIYKETGSGIPIIGGMLAAVGMLLSGEAKLENFFWVPLLLDMGCVPMVIFALIPRNSRR